MMPGFNLDMYISARLLFNANSTLLCREKVNFQWDDDEVRFVLDQHALLNFHSASSMKQQFVVRHAAPLGHIILIPSQAVIVLSP
jgi:cupin superfamily acireductone dioxygenase involved in methionine salvage